MDESELDESRVGRKQGWTKTGWTKMNWTKTGSTAAHMYHRFGLKINAGKTEVLAWSPSNESSFSLLIDGESLIV